MFSTSDTTAKLDAALAKAQGEIETAVKTQKNDAFKKKDGTVSKYADISDIWTAMRPALLKYGIAMTQWPVHRDGTRLHLITRLAHEGEWMMCEMSFPVREQTAHGYVGAITYSRKCAGAAAVGVVTEEDDDGNAASGVKTNGKAGLSASVYEPDDRMNDDPFPDIKGTEGRPTYKSEKNDAPAEYLFLQSTIRALRTENDLLDWGADETNKAAINKLPAKWIPNFREEFKDRLQALRNAA